jgi:hypothetical protein
MGEAKRRGTYEQRKAEGEIKCAERQAEHEKRMRFLKQRRGKSVMPLVAAMMASTMSV